MLKTTEISNLNSCKIELSTFDSNQLDIAIIKNLISDFPLSYESEIKYLQFKFPSTQLSLEDGFFLPLPYSTINEQFENEKVALDSYFSKAFIAKNEFKSQQILWFNWFEQQLTKCFKEKIELLKFNNETFAPFGIRVLTANKNGLDIHCENAFLHQLKPNFRNWLSENVDLENSVSFFITLQAPEIGGELVVYNMDWNNFALQLDSTTYEERHDLNGSLFKNRNKNDVTSSSYNMQKGDAVVFRAAQLWHAIQPPIGLKNRITVGCFIAKGRDGNFYYWA
jgi:hypothetical protein